MPDLSLDRGLDFTIKLILFRRRPLSADSGASEFPMSGPPGDGVLSVLENMLDAALRLSDNRIRVAGEFSLVLGRSAWKVDVGGRRGDDGDEVLSMLDERDFTSFRDLNSGVPACGDGVLSPPKDEGGRWPRETGRGDADGLASIVTVIVILIAKLATG